MSRLVTGYMLIILAMTTLADSNSTQMIMRSVSIPPSLIDVVLEGDSVSGDFLEITGTNALANTDEALKDFMERAGIPFPQGSSIHYDDTLHRLTIVNTLDNIKLFDRIMIPGDCGPRQIQLNLRYYRIPHKVLGTDASREDVEATYATNDIYLIDSLICLSHSGVSLMTSSRTTLSSDTNSWHGSDLTSSATVGPDGDTIDLVVSWSARYNFSHDSDTSLVSARNLTASFAVRSGRTSVILEFNQGNYFEYLTARATIIDTNASEYKWDDYEAEPAPPAGRGEAPRP